MRRRKPNKTSKTQRSTLRLFKKGYTPEQIALQRDLTVGSIIGHLASLLTLKKLDIHELVEPSVIQKVEEAIKATDTYRLTPIKEYCPEEISYNEIKLVIGYLKGLAETSEPTEEL
jgi:uncharacterized protein YpbB